MTTTTILSEDSATIVRDDMTRFNWSAAIVGAVIATAVTFFLVTLGSWHRPCALFCTKCECRRPQSLPHLRRDLFLRCRGFRLCGWWTYRGTTDRTSSREHQGRRISGWCAWLGGLGDRYRCRFGGGRFCSHGRGLRHSRRSRRHANKAQAAPVSYWADMLLSPATPVFGTYPRSRTRRKQAVFSRWIWCAAPTSTVKNRKRIGPPCCAGRRLVNAGAIERVNATETKCRMKPCRLLNPPAKRQVLSASGLRWRCFSARRFGCCRDIGALGRRPHHLRLDAPARSPLMAENKVERTLNSLWRILSHGRSRHPEAADQMMKLHGNDARIAAGPEGGRDAEQGLYRRFLRLESDCGGDQRFGRKSGQDS